MAESIPPLREIALNEISQLGPLPTTRIKTDDDIAFWKSTRSYLDYKIFLSRLNRAVAGYFLPWEPKNRSQPVEKILTLLETLDAWIDEIPPLKTPQRFGNLAFRTWGGRLEERADSVLAELLGSDFLPAIPYIKPYFLTSFGQFTRMDYGTGHEASFGLFLLCLTLIRFLEPRVEAERDLVLAVFLRYMRLCWRLQDVYKLEPAGSHGVWGLDDYCFLPYIFGSGQLQGQSLIPVSEILHSPLPATNLYFLAIMRIHDVKQGPFHEHSSQLYSIATGVPKWGKVNSGLFKMYDAEVLGKHVVVQHIPLGGLLEWKPAGDDGSTQDIVDGRSQGSASSKWFGRCEDLGFLLYLESLERPNVIFITVSIMRTRLRRALHFGHRHVVGYSSGFLTSLKSIPSVIVLSDLYRSGVVIAKPGLKNNSIYVRIGMCS